MPKWLKISVWIALLAAFFLGLAFYFYFSDPLPTGHSPEQADKLALHMLEALDYEAYEETRYLSWSYRGGRNTYRWDKALGKVEMTWDGYSGVIDLVSPEKSTIQKDGNPVPREKLQELTAEAISNFNNDSFWLVAPFKIFDRGTRRSLVTLDDGSSGLLVTYTQGGDTPGDSYIWKLDDRMIPTEYRMWVSILPLKGLSASWEGWHKTESGVLLPQFHKLGPFTLDLGRVATSK